MKSVFGAIGAVGAIYIAFSATTMTRKELIGRMDGYYQSQFADLRLIKEGNFGTSRVENSGIKDHGRRGGDPGYGSKEWWNSVEIWGNKGAPLAPASIERRYHRFWNGLPTTKLRPSLPKVDMKAFVAKAAALFSKREKRSHSMQAGDVYFEARPISLSKAECLPCHKPMKLGDPVAVIVYAAVPLRDKPNKGG